MNWHPHRYLPHLEGYDDDDRVVARCFRTMSEDTPYVVYGVGDRTWSAWGAYPAEAIRNFESNYIAPGRGVVGSVG